jgi:hypothetical protein
MAPLTSLVSALFLASCATAHFHVRTPAPLGTTTEKENIGPCGGETADFSKKGTDFHVGGDAIGLSSGHPVSQWGFRITTDQKAEGNWTEIYQQFEQQGPGDICLPKVSVPESYVGKKALLNIVSSGDDGMLFQCALVNFVAGTAQNTPSECKNSTATTSFKKEPQLTAVLESNGNTTPSNSKPDSGADSWLSVPTASLWTAVGGLALAFYF